MPVGKTVIHLPPSAAVGFATIAMPRSAGALEPLGDLTAVISGEFATPKNDLDVKEHYPLLCGR